MMSIGRLHTESTVSWLKPTVAPMNLKKEEPVLKKFIKALAILVLGLLLHILFGYTEKADTRISESSHMEVLAGDTENTVIEMIQITNIK
jgi:chromate transport protein ChrA